MTSRECFENKWFYMKYIGKYLSEEILLTRECRLDPDSVIAKYIQNLIQNIFLFPSFAMSKAKQIVV